jgi:hypothetical protein
MGLRNGVVVCLLKCVKISRRTDQSQCADSGKKSSHVIG